MRKNLKNLKPFKPGESGNPEGRPKKLPKLDDLLANVPEEKWMGLIDDLFKLAKKDVRAAEILLARGFGPVKQIIESKNENINSVMPTPEEAIKIKAMLVRNI